MVRLKDIINETKDYSSATYISVDIQEAYEGFIHFPMQDYARFLNHTDFNNLIFLYNGESMGFSGESEYKMWLYDHNVHDHVLNTSKFYDKGYAFFRSCMDEGIDETHISNFVRFMIDNDIHDSRDLDRDMWATYIRKYRHTDKKELYDFLNHSEEMIYIPDVMEFLKPYTNIILTGGGITECLKEVEIALTALNKKYKIDDRYTYG